MNNSEKTYLAVRVTPRSGRNEVVGIKTLDTSNESGAYEVSVRVTAPPDGGKANGAVCKLIAASLNIPKSAVSVSSGQTSRHKRLSVTCEKSRLIDWLSTLPKI